MLLEGLTEFGAACRVTGENEGRHLLRTGRRGQTEPELISNARALGVRVYGLSDSLVGKAGGQPGRTVLLGYGGLEPQEIKNGLALLRQAWL